MHATAILSWKENIVDEDDVPPRWMWHLDHEIEDWFARLDDSKDRDDDDGPRPNLAQNALTAHLRR